MIEFRALAIGQTFNFIDNTGQASFFDWCEKISTRKYRSKRTGQEYQVGTVRARVYHVDELEPAS